MSIIPFLVLGCIPCVFLYISVHSDLDTEYLGGDKMTYDCKLESLLELLYKGVPFQVERITRERRNIELGLLSVGFKLHCPEEIPQLTTLFEQLWHAEAPAYKNYYRKTHGVDCWVLPPVGSASIAIALIEAIEQTYDIEIFDNPSIQIQVCSPGRLSQQATALLTIGKYLGSDIVRWYNFSELSTTFSRIVLPGDENRRWGHRLSIYDAGGYLDTSFAWWYRRARGLEIAPCFPFDRGRTDIIDASSRRDIRNINLLATLLLHTEYTGFWTCLGTELRCDIGKLLEKHQLQHLLDMSWITTGRNADANDLQYYLGLTELMSYALDEMDQLKRDPDRTGILKEMQTLLDTYHEEVRRQALATSGSWW